MINKTLEIIYCLSKIRMPDLTASEIWHMKSEIFLQVQVNFDIQNYNFEFKNSKNEQKKK